MKLADEQKVGARMGWLKDGTSFRTYDDSCMKSNVTFDCKLKSRELTQDESFLIAHDFSLCSSFFYSVEKRFDCWTRTGPSTTGFDFDPTHQDRKALAAAYLLQSELALLKILGTKGINSWAGENRESRVVFVCTMFAVACCPLPRVWCSPTFWLLLVFRRVDLQLGAFVNVVNIYAWMNRYID